jgi:hypothetical protein
MPAPETARHRVRRRSQRPDADDAGLTAMLADAGDDPEDQIPVAIETPRGLLVAVLRASWPNYSVSPAPPSIAPSGA